MVGADHPHTLVLPNGNVLWTFQDARICTPTDTRYVHNIGLMQIGICFGVFVGSSRNRFPRPVVHRARHRRPRPARRSSNPRLLDCFIVEPGPLEGETGDPPDPADSRARLRSSRRTVDGWRSRNSTTGGAPRFSSSQPAIQPAPPRLSSDDQSARSVPMTATPVSPRDSRARTTAFRTIQ
jgi:hypothetical protein